MQAGVSIATVSRVINQNALVSEKTTREVQKAITRLSYVPRPAAQILASRRTKTLGLIMSDIGGAFFTPMLRGIEAGVREAGYSLLIQTTGEINNGQSKSPALGVHNTDGALVFTDSLESKELVNFYKASFPVVLMHQSSPNAARIPTVTIENKDGAASIVNHLIHVHGRKRIVFMQGPPSHEDAVWREKGYREALESAGLPFEKELILQGNFNENDARQSIQKFLDSKPDFDAVFCADDDSACGALLGLHEAGIRVPQDVSVAGFDDAPFAPYLYPPLTTIHAPTEEVGRTAINQLFRIIHGEAVDPLILLPTRMVVRNSCGCIIP
jgi:LacI family transcriptional regulator